MATKLKHLKVKKVDFVDEGANPEAHIKLYKKKDGTNAPGVSPGDGDKVTGSGVMKRLLTFIAKAAGMKQEEIDSAIDEIQKSESVSFHERINEISNRKIADEMWDICFALQSSLCSILNDDDLDSTGALTAMQGSLEEFNEVARDSILQWSSGKAGGIVRKDETTADLGVMKSAVARLNDTIEKVQAGKETVTNQKPKGEKEMAAKIDKSKMTPAEKAFYEEIEKRCSVDEGTASDAGGTAEPVADAGTAGAGAAGVLDNPVAKSATQPPADTTPISAEQGTDDIYKGLHPAVRAEMEALRKFREDAEDKDIHDVAKRYAIIGKKEEELFPVLKSLKAAGGTAYNDMVAVLDQAVDTVEKSGAFSEIGKSGGHGGSAGDEAWAKAEVKAAEIMKSKTGVTKQQALDEVFRTDPELAQECEKEE